LDRDDTLRGRLRDLFCEDPFGLACENAFDLDPCEGRRRVCGVDSLALDLVDVEEVQTVSCIMGVSIDVAVDEVVDRAIVAGSVFAIGVDDVLYEREETVASEEIAAEVKCVWMQGFNVILPVPWESG
jgi:hypothetical protein